MDFSSLVLKVPEKVNGIVPCKPKVETFFVEICLFAKVRVVKKKPKRKDKLTRTIST